MTRRGLLLLTAAASSARAIELARNRRELFIDRYLIESLEGDASLRFGTPVPRETVLKLDRPYEGPFSAYFTVLLCDDKRYRLYYRGVPDAGQDGRSNEVTCYAESEDGIEFRKPAENILLRAQPPYSHNFCPFIDRNPKAAGGRYKAISGTAKSGLRGWHSDDALHWKPFREEPLFAPTKLPMFDSQNLVFWSEVEGCYVAYVRQFRNNIRSVVRSTSPDFVTWTQPFTPLEIGGATGTHLYTNQLHPYFRAPHIYTGIAARFLPGRQVLSDDDAKQAGIVAGYYKDTSDSVLLTARAGVTAATRIDRDLGDDAFLRPGYGISHWSSRGNYPALNIVPSATAEDEMNFYVNRHYGQPTAHLQRFTLRTDGLASLHASSRGGVCTTKPVTIPADAKLELNFATSAAGSVRVAVPEAGLTFENCEELIGDRLQRIVRWRGNPAIAAGGKPVRLQFQLRDADLYSFRLA